MADNLIFPIQFDLEKAVNEAGQQWDKKYAKKLEGYINKRPIKVKIDFENLTDVKTRLAQLKIEPITPETKAAIKELARELQTLARALEQVQKYSRNPTKGTVDASKVQLNEERARAQAALAAQRAARAEANLAQARLNDARAANVGTAATHNANKAYVEQSGYLQRLTQRMAVYASFSAIGTFLTSVREVTAEFELQRVSLGAIIQDQVRANQLFSEIKAFALKSPVSILDLTKYTKQLAAYKIGVDELFETTKKLTDVSVGLGVSMDRVVLAYGQTRATGYLRACLGAGTRVKMYDGSYKNVEDVAGGDILMGDDEQPRHVSKLYQGEQQMYRVRYDNGEYRCNEHHILTVYDAFSERISDVFVLDYLKEPLRYQGVRRINGGYKTFLMKVEKDAVDTYYGFSIDGNHRFIIQDNIVTHNTEIRQFTEMGVPIVEELAAKLSKMNGELVTAAEVMDMVSKRGISFELVKEVFDDMTSAGGMFYNMQEKQGNTLFGLWAKLGDAASVMYDEIGNTESVNNGMKAAIQTLTDLMRNWQAVSDTILYTGIPTALMGMLAKYSLSTSRKTAADMAAAAATERRKAATLQLSEALRKETVNDINAAYATFKKAESDEVAAKKAASKTGLIASGFKSIASSMAMGLGIGAVIALVTSLTYDLFKAWNEANKLKNELKDISTENAVQQAQQVRQFEYLADRATNVALSDRERNEALQELHRTFKDQIPVENMSIENLQRMADGAGEAAHKYTELTNALKEYIAEQNRQKALSAIQAEIQPKITKELGRMRDILKDKGFGVTEQARFVSEMTTVFSDPDKIGRPLHDNVVEALRNAGIDGGEELADRLIRGSGWDRFVRGINKVNFGLGGHFGLDPDKWSFLNNPLLGIMNWTADTEEHAANLANALKEMNALTEEQNRNYKNQTKDLGAYKDEWERVQKQIADSQEYTNDDRDRYRVSQENKNTEIRKYIQSLQSVMGEYWDDGFATIEENVGASGERMSQIFFDKFNDPKWLSKLPLHLQNYIATVQDAYNRLEPKDSLINAINRKFRTMAIGVNANMNKMEQYVLRDGDKIEEKLKSLQDTLDGVNADIYRYSQANEKAKHGVLSPTAIVTQQKLEELRKESQALALFIELLQGLVAPKSNGGSPRSTRRQEIVDEIGLLEKLYKEYRDMERLEGATRAEADMRKLYSDNLKELADRYGIDLPRSVETYQSAVDTLIDKLRELRKQARTDGERRNLDIAIREATFKRDKAGMDDAQKQIEQQIKKLSERISRTKTAKEFYERILGMTGDYELAASVSMSIYGDTGYDLQRQLAEQIRGYFQNDTLNIAIPVDVITEDNQINYKRLGEFAEQMKEKLGEEPYQAIKKIAEEGMKDRAKAYEGYMKDLETAKTYADKRVELARTTAARIREIESDPQLSKEQKVELRRGYQEREDREAARLEYEAFKDTPLYTQMFEDLEHASTSTLEMMKERLEALSRVWGVALDPTQLKEIQSRMNEIDGQLRERNPFKTLKESYDAYRKAVADVTEAGALTNAREANKTYAERSVIYGADSAQARAAEKELKAREKIAEIARQITAENKKGQKALDAAAQKANDNLQIARGRLELASAEEQAAREESTYKDPNQDPAVIAAHKKVEAAKEEVNLAERVARITANTAKSAKTLKDNMADAADAAVGVLGDAANIAKGIADIAEAMGSDEETVQYWNDIGDALNMVAGGIQDIVQAAVNGNIMGIISGVITAIPKMFAGFTKLFNAGRIKRANREIKRQQELIDALEYSYSRLEKVADRTFGTERIGNWQQRMKALEAQQQAYMKQAAAERSKGKDADKAKIREYEQAARDAADQIRDMKNEMSEFFLGTDVASAAEEFAQAWLEAYLTFASTTDAMQEKFADMVKNMVVNSLMAKVVQARLEPIFKQIDEMAKDGELTAREIAEVTAGIPDAVRDIDQGLRTTLSSLYSNGIDVRNLMGEAGSATGIKRDIATASEESINGLAAGINTQNYYMSLVPGIAANVAAMRARMDGGGLSMGDVSAAGWTDWQQQAMEHYQAIARNTAETVTECRRAANAAVEAVETMKKVVRPKGSPGAYAINTQIVG